MATSGFRPDRLGKLEQAGRIEGDRFIVETVPAPPEARSVEIVDHDARATFVGYEIRHACPHCHGDIAYRYGRQYSDRFALAIEQNDAANRSLYAQERMLRQILDAYDPDAGAETYRPEGVP